MSSYSLELYEFNQKLEELANCKGRATELVSLYIPPTKKIHDIAAYLRNEASQSANIKSKSTRKNVSAAIESITSRLKAYKAPPEKGMVFFVEEAAHEWYKRVAESCSEFYASHDIKSILIGGPGATKDYFKSNEYLNHEFQKLVIDTFDTGYTDETGLKELVSIASDRLQEVQLIQEKELMDRFMKEVISGKLSCYGVVQVQKALTMGAVKTLLISDMYEHDNRVSVDGYKMLEI